VLAQYFRTHEVGDEWAEYKEMFALFDNGLVDIDPETETDSKPQIAHSEKPTAMSQQPKEKPKIKALRWVMAGIAASIVLLLAFHLGRSTAEQPPVTAENIVTPKDDVQPSPIDITPTEIKDEEPLVAQVTPAKPQRTKRPSVEVAKTETVSPTENLADCIARLEAEMENLDDSVSTAHMEQLIAADRRLQQMVSRISGKQAEQAINEITNDSTANYILF